MIAVSISRDASGSWQALRTEQWQTPRRPYWHASGEWIVEHDRHRTTAPVPLDPPALRAVLLAADSIAVTVRGLHETHRLLQWHGAGDRDRQAAALDVLPAAIDEALAIIARPPADFRPALDRANPDAALWFEYLVGWPPEAHS